MKIYKIKEICHLEKGKQIDTTLLNDNNPYKYINGGIKQTGYYTSYNTEGEAVLVSEGGASCGYVNYINEKFWCGCHCYKLTECKCLTKYLYYALKGNQDKLMALRTGTAMPNIKKSTFQAMELNLNENIFEQETVINTLDKVQLVIDAKKAELNDLDVLVKSRFIEMFGDPILNEKNWNTEIWENVLIIVNGRNQKGVEDDDGHYLICGSGGVIGKASQYLVNANSVIVGRKGNINKPILMREKYWNVDTAFGLEPNIEKINADYLYMFCKFFDFETLNKAVTIPSLTKSDLLKIEMPIPPIELQNQFADFVKQVDKSKFSCYTSDSYN